MPSPESKRAWSKSKNLQISLQGYIQALIHDGHPAESPESQKELVNTAYELFKLVESFADKKVGFDRAADQGPSAHSSVDDDDLDIPF